MSEVEPCSFGARVHALGVEQPSAVALRFVATDGTEHALTWSELDARSSQIARAMADRGVGSRRSGSGAPGTAPAGDGRPAGAAGSTGSGAPDAGDPNGTAGSGGTGDPNGTAGSASAGGSAGAGAGGAAGSGGAGAGGAAGSDDRVAIALQNSVELVASVLAAWKLGAVPVPVRWDLPAWEQQRVLDVIAGALVIGPDELGWLRATTSLDASPLPELVSPQTHGICSSGSTGTPKVILTERPALFDETVGQPFPSGWMEVPRPQRVLVPTQLYHTNGFATLFGLLAGDELTLLERFDARRVVDLIERLGISTFTATPTMLQRIADLPDIDERDLSSIEWILQGAAVIPPSLVHRWFDLVGSTHFFMAYGMTEGLGLAAVRGDEWLARPGTVGQGYRETEIRILDVAGHDVPVGELGEIYLRSPTNGMYRYLGGAPLLPTTPDGFGSAGDVGRLDDDGFLYIVDRRIDMIVTGGANVYPAEVESALIDHPAIADVVVVGLADPEWGRRVHAIVEPADPAAPPTPDDVISFAKTRVASYKAPKTVELIDRIPRSEATKVNRAALIATRGG